MIEKEIDHYDLKYHQQVKLMMKMIKDIMKTILTKDNIQGYKYDGWNLAKLTKIKTNKKTIFSSILYYHLFINLLT